MGASAPTAPISPAPLVITKIYFSKRNIYGRQKINLIINFLKNEKIWILKMLYGKHLLDF